MTDLERQIIELRLAKIDVRRSQLEAMLSTMPPNAPCCDGDGDCYREELESELKSLWAMRSSLVKLRA